MHVRKLVGPLVASISVLIVTAGLCGCQSTRSTDAEPVLLGTIDDFEEATRGAPVDFSVRPEAAPAIPFRNVEMLREPPPRGYRTIGTVLVFVEKPIPGLTANVGMPWRWVNPPPADVVRDSGGSMGTTTIRGREGAGSAELHEALQSRAAQMGASAVVALDSGIDQHGRLWASGIALGSPRAQRSADQRFHVGRPLARAPLSFTRPRVIELQTDEVTE